MTKIGLKQVAERAGVSIATVSYVFSGRRHVPTPTKDLVLRAADELGYIRNAAASRLRSGQSRLIGVILNNLANPFFAVLVAELESVAYREGYLTLVATAQNDLERQQKLIESMVSQGVAAIILSPVHRSRQDVLRPAAIRHIPIVTCVRALPGDAASFIGVDDAQAGYLAGQALTRSGHDSALFLGGYEKTSTFEGRRQGVLRAFAEAGMPADRCQFVNGPLSTDFGARQFGARAAAHRPKTGVLCFNDTVAVGVYDAARQNGLRPGRDVSVIGFDNVPVGRALHPGLSTVDIFPGRMGEQAATMAISLIASPDAPQSAVRLTPVFIRRESVIAH